MDEVFNVFPLLNNEGICDEDSTTCRTHIFSVFCCSQVLSQCSYCCHHIALQTRTFVCGWRRDATFDVFSVRPPAKQTPLYIHVNIEPSWPFYIPFRSTVFMDPYHTAAEGNRTSCTCYPAGKAAVWSCGQLLSCAKTKNFQVWRLRWFFLKSRIRRSQKKWWRSPTMRKERKERARWWRLSRPNRNHLRTTFWTLSSLPLFRGRDSNLSVILASMMPQSDRSAPVLWLGLSWRIVTSLRLKANLKQKVVVRTLRQCMTLAKEVKIGTRKKLKQKSNIINTMKVIQRQYLWETGTEGIQDGNSSCKDMSRQGARGTPSTERRVMRRKVAETAGSVLVSLFLETSDLKIEADSACMTTLLWGERGVHDTPGWRLREMNGDGKHRKPLNGLRYFTELGFGFPSWHALLLEEVFGCRLEGGRLGRCEAYYENSRTWSYWEEGCCWNMNVNRWRTLPGCRRC